MRAEKDIHISDNAQVVLKRRYLMKDKTGRVIETPRDMFIRVAKFIAEADRSWLTWCSCPTLPP